MTRASYVVFSEPRPGREEDFAAWYDVHIREMLAVPGVIAARRYWRVDDPLPGVVGEGRRHLAVYEIDAADLADAMSQIVIAAASMGPSDSVDGTSTLATLYVAAPAAGSRPTDAADFTLADRIECHELAARYGHLIDDRDWSGLSRVFVDDAVFVLRGFGELDARLEGIEAIRGLMESGRHPVGHHVTDVVVDDSDGVRMRSKIVAPGVRGRVGSADYHDQLRRTPEGWRIAERVVVLRSGSASPNEPEA